MPDQVCCTEMSRMCRMSSCYFDLLILQHCLYAGKQRSLFFFFTLLLTCTQRHSQLDLSLFEFLQRPLSFTRRESWGELSSLNSTEELHQQVKSEEENTVKPRWTAENTCKKLVSGCRVLRPVRSLSGVGEAEDGAELHAQDEVENEEGLFT